MSSGSSLATGPIIGIVIGSAVGLAMCTYMCCFRKYVMRKQTQKLMDATNLMHAQEPQGTISPGVLPDGSIGLLVRPLPTNASMAVVPPVTLTPPNVYPPQQPPQQPPQYPPQNSAFHSTTVSAPPLVPELSIHPRPGVAVTLNGESIDRIAPQEIKGIEQSSGRWEPRPFVPPTRSSFVSSGNSESGSSGPLWQTNPVPVAGGGNNINRQERHPQERNPNDASPSSTVHIPSNSNSRNYHELDPNLIPPRTPHNPHEPVIPQP